MTLLRTTSLGGWDSPIYLGDEQKRPRDPGRSVLISITFCTLWVIFLLVCLQGLAPSSAITANASNVLPFLAGRRIMAMVRAPVRPSALLTPAGFGNPMAALAAVGGSTNAIIHLCAVAGWRGLSLPLRQFAEVSARLPVITDIAPIGTGLMPDLARAGRGARCAGRDPGPPGPFRAHGDQGTARGIAAVGASPVAHREGPRAGRPAVPAARR